MKKSLQFFIFMIAIILPAISPASASRKQLLNESKQRIQALQDKQNLDMRNKLKNQTALTNKAVIDTIVPAYSYTEPTKKHRNMVTPEQKVERENEITRLNNGKTIRSLMFDENDEHKSTPVRPKSSSCEPQPSQYYSSKVKRYATMFEDEAYIPGLSIITKFDTKKPERKLTESVHSSTSTVEIHPSPTSINYNHSPYQNK